jgi:hypothetical protein
LRARRLNAPFGGARLHCRERFEWIRPTDISNALIARGICRGDSIRCCSHLRTGGIELHAFGPFLVGVNADRDLLVE